MGSRAAGGRALSGRRSEHRVAPTAVEALQVVLDRVGEGDDVAAEVAARYALQRGAGPLDVAVAVIDELARLRTGGAGLLVTSDAEVRARRLFVRMGGPRSRHGRQVLLFADHHDALTVGFCMVLEAAGARVSTVVSADAADVLHLAYEQPWDRVVVDHVGLRRSARTARELLAPVIGAEPRAHVVVAGSGEAVTAERGVTWVSRDLRQMVLACGALTADPLTEREREVLSAVAAGRSNEQIGRQLQLSLSTVKTYLERIHSKLGSVDRASAVATAVRGGWI